MGEVSRSHVLGDSLQPMTVCLTALWASMVHHEHVLAISHAGRQPVADPPTRMRRHLLLWKPPSSLRLYCSSSSLCPDPMMIQRMTLAAQSPLLPRRASNLFPTDHAPGLNKVHPGVEKKKFNHWLQNFLWYNLWLYTHIKEAKWTKSKFYEN